MMFLSRFRSLNKLEGSKGSSEWRKLLKDRFPSVYSIGRIASQVYLDEVRKANRNLYSVIRRMKALSPIESFWIGILDGHEMITTRHCSCEDYLVRRVRTLDGKEEQYYHRYVTFLLAGLEITLLLDIEPIHRGEDEVSAALRLIQRVCKNFLRAFKVVVCDGLYLQAKVFDLLDQYRKYIIAVLKDKNREIYKDANSLFPYISPERFRDGKTEYEIWDVDHLTSWKNYKKGVRVVKSWERTTERRHAANPVLSGEKWETVVSERSWLWATNLPEKMISARKVVILGHKRWQIENQGYNELVNLWHADHVYKHDANAIPAFLLFLFIAYNILNVFYNRNLKDPQLKRTKNIYIGSDKCFFISIN